MSRRRSKRQSRWRRILDGSGWLRGPHRSGKLTGFGRSAIWLTVGLGFAAVNSGNNLLYLLLGLLLSAFVLSGVLSELALRRVDVQLRTLPRLFVEEPARVALLLRQRGALAAVDLALRWRGDAPALRRAYCAFAAEGSDGVAVWGELRPKRRGVFQVTGILVTTRFPFALLAKTREIPLAFELCVYPQRNARVTVNRLPNETLGEVLSRGPKQGDLREVRAYSPGDSLARIHWKRSASRGELVTRVPDRNADAHRVVRLDAVIADGGERPAFEARLVEASSALDWAVQTGTALTIEVTGYGRRLAWAPGRAPDAVWRELALLEPVVRGSEPLKASSKSAPSVDGQAPDTDAAGARAAGSQGASPVAYSGEVRVAKRR